MNQKGKRKLIVLGGIGRNERENRDNMRVIDRGGCMYNLKAHICMDHPLVVKRWKKR